MLSSWVSLKTCFPAWVRWHNRLHCLYNPLPEASNLATWSDRATDCSAHGLGSLLYRRATQAGIRPPRYEGWFCTPTPFSVSIWSPVVEPCRFPQWCWWGKTWVCLLGSVPQHWRSWIPTLGSLSYRRNHRPPRPYWADLGEGPWGQSVGQLLPFWWVPPSLCGPVVRGDLASPRGSGVFTMGSVCG